MKNILNISRALIAMDKLAEMSLQQQTLQSTSQNRKGSITTTNNSKMNPKYEKNEPGPTQLVENPVDRLIPGGINAY